MSTQKAPPTKSSRRDDISSAINRVEKLVKTSEKEDKKKRESTNSKNTTSNSKPCLPSASSQRGEKKSFDYSRLMIKVPAMTKEGPKFKGTTKK